MEEEKRGEDKAREMREKRRVMAVKVATRARKHDASLIFEAMRRMEGLDLNWQW